MKIARLTHIRCQEWAASTFVWVRDDMTEDQFQERVYNAEKEYLAALKEFAEADKDAFRPYSYTINWEKQRERNVGEVLDEHKRRSELKADYEARRRGALRPFDDYLAKQEGVVGFYDHEPEVEAEVDWGHKHATKIEYGETSWPRFRLLKPTKKGEPGSQVMVITDDEEWL